MSNNLLAELRQAREARQRAAAGTTTAMTPSTMLAATHVAPFSVARPAVNNTQAAFAATTTNSTWRTPVANKPKCVAFGARGVTTLADLAKKQTYKRNNVVNADGLMSPDEYDDENDESSDEGGVPFDFRQLRDEPDDEVWGKKLRDAAAKDLPSNEKETVSAKSVDVMALNERPAKKKADCAQGTQGTTNLLVELRQAREARQRGATVRTFTATAQPATHAQRGEVQTSIDAAITAAVASASHEQSLTMTTSDSSEDITTKRKLTPSQDTEPLKKSKAT